MPTQARYEKPDGTIIAYGESVPGSTTFDVPGVALAGTLVRQGARPRIGYSPESPGKVNWGQYGLNKYFNPDFRFSCDLNPSYSLADLRSFGFSAFYRSITDAEQGQLNAEFIAYGNESSLHGPLEGVGYYEASIDAYFNQIYPTVYRANAGTKYVVHNLETSNEWWPGNTPTQPGDQPYPGFQFYGTYRIKNSHSWEVGKNISILLESTGETITLEQLANRGQGAWQNEMVTRRTNRILMLMQVTRFFADPFGALVGFGSSCYQGNPTLAGATSTGIFQDGSGNGQYIGADANGWRTFGNIPIRFVGNAFTYETFHLNYDYPEGPYMLASDYNDIWNGGDQSKKTHEYISSKMIPKHEFAFSKAKIQGIQYRMRQRWHETPIVMMTEMMLEFARLVLIDANGNFYQSPELRAPLASLQGSIRYHVGQPDQYIDTPKPWFPPGYHYTRYIVYRFFLANKPGSGTHIFEDKTPFRQDGQDSTWTPMYQHHLHNMSQLLQGRHAMQPFERFLGASTLVEDPAVKRQGESGFSVYSGAQAFNFDGQTVGPQKPAFGLRFLDRGDGWEVLLAGGHIQGNTATTTVTVMAPGLLNGAMFQVDLTGRWAHIFHFFVPKTDNNQTYTATGNNVSNWNKPGYADRVNQ